MFIRDGVGCTASAGWAWKTSENGAENSRRVARKCTTMKEAEEDRKFRTRSWLRTRAPRSTNDCRATCIIDHWRFGHEFKRFWKTNWVIGICWSDDGFRKCWQSAANVNVPRIFRALCSGRKNRRNFSFCSGNSKRMFIGVFKDSCVNLYIIHIYVCICARARACVWMCRHGQWTSRVVVCAGERRNKNREKKNKNGTFFTLFPTFIDTHTKRYPFKNYISTGVRIYI